MHIISYFRTGSHWLIYSIQDYFNTKVDTKDGSQRVENAWISHSHDKNIQEDYNEYIYLWRDPVDVVFSTIVFTRTERCLNTVDPIIRPITRYARHYKKWIEKPCKKKLILSYEDLQLNYHETFKKVVEFLEGKVDDKKIDALEQKITRDHIAGQVRPQVIPKGDGYEKKKKAFRKMYGEMIYAMFDAIVKYGYE